MPCTMSYVCWRYSPTALDTEALNAETRRIFASAMGEGSLPQNDMSYIGQAVAKETGISQADAEKRVSEPFSRLQEKSKQLQSTAREAADKARKAAAYSALWLFISLLIGAFCASLAATFGGRQRDQI